MKSPRELSSCLVLGCIWFCLMAASAYGQTCNTSDDMDAATRTAISNAANRYFGMVAKGDSSSLQQNAIPSLASNFAGIEAAVHDNQTNLSGATGNLRPPFELKVEGTVPLARAEFLCGVFGAKGQTANSAEFVIPNLPPGDYAIAIEDVTTSKGPYAVTFVLQKEGTDWKLGGLYVKNNQVGGHDGNWYADQARAYKAKNQNHNAWFYF